MLLPQPALQPRGAHGRGGSLLAGEEQEETITCHTQVPEAAEGSQCPAHGSGLRCPTCSGQDQVGGQVVTWLT